MIIDDALKYHESMTKFSKVEEDDRIGDYGAAGGTSLAARLLR